jgi:hypothetical protein
MRKLFLTIMATLAMTNATSQISIKELDEDMSHPFSHEMAILDENGKTLFVEKQDDDKQIIGYGHDFFIVYRQSTNKVYVKSPKGVVLSGMEIPEGCYVEPTNYDMMTEHEQAYALNGKIAFTIVNPENEHRTVYNKHCKRIGGY